MVPVPLTAYPSLSGICDGIVIEFPLTTAFTGFTKLSQKLVIRILVTSVGLFTIVRLKLAAPVTEPFSLAL